MPRKRDQGVKENASAAAVKLLERNMRMVEMRLQGRTLPEIAAEMKVSPRTVRRAWEEYREISMMQLRGEDPEEAVWEVLEKYELAARSYWEVYEAAKGAHSVRVGALKGYVDVVEKEMQLRQACGLIPRRLGEVAVQINMRFVATTLRQVLDKYADEMPEGALVELVDALKGGVDRARAGAAAALGE